MQEIDNILDFRRVISKKFGIKKKDFSFIRKFRSEEEAFLQEIRMDEKSMA